MSWLGDMFRANTSGSTWLGDNARFAQEGAGELADALDFSGSWHDYLFADPEDLSNYLAAEETVSNGGFPEDQTSLPEEQSTDDLTESSTQDFTEDILDADLLYGSAYSDDSLMPAIEELENRGYRVEKFDKGDIDRKNNDVYVKGVPGQELAGKDMIWRSIGLVDSRGEWDEILNDLEQLRLDGVKTLPTPQGSIDCDDKKRTKERLGRRGVAATKSYDTYEDIIKAQEEGEIVVEKPKTNSGGEGVRFIDPDQYIDFNPDNVYEEFVDHYEGPHTVERRAIMFTGDDINQLVEVKNRELRNYEGKPTPKNISGNNDGCYTDLDLEDKPLIDREIGELLDVSEAMGGGLLGLDYTVDTRTGETKVIEVNSNPGLNGIAEASEVDIYDEIADSIGKEIDGESIGRTYSEHLDDVTAYGVEEEILEDQASEAFEGLEPATPDAS